MPYITLILIVVFSYAGLWGIFKKAGRPGWASIIPVYSDIVLLQMADRPIWWLFLLFLPFVNIIFNIVIWLDILRAFRKPQWHIILAVFLPFLYFPYLGFSDSEYFKGFDKPF